MSKKLFIAAVALIAFFVFVVWRFGGGYVAELADLSVKSKISNSSEVYIDNFENSDIDTKGQESQISEAKMANKLSQAEYADLPGEEGGIALDQDQAVELRDWIDANDEQSEQYISYSDVQLIELAESRDFRAVTELANREFKKNGATDKAAGLYFEASALGSVSSLAHQERLQRARQGNNMDERKKAWVEAFAWQEVRRMRGGLVMGDTSHLYGFSTEQMLRIPERAWELYLLLEEKRRDFGLPPFENSTPEVIARFGDMEVLPDSARSRD